MRRTSFAISVCLLACIARADWQANFADNPSAETDANRDGNPDGWVPATYRSPAKTGWDKAVAHSGAASLRVRDSKHATGTAWDENSGRWVSAARRPVKAGATYTLSVWIRTANATGSATACIAWWKGKSWVAESYTKKVSGTSDWQRVEVAAKPPAGADGAQVYLSLSRSQGTAWFDDVTMVEGTRLPGNFRPVDLAAACTTGFRDDVAGDGKGGWTDQGDNDLRSVPHGRIELRGVPFHILDGERTCIVLKGRGREKAPASAAVPVGRTCETLYFLHACAWGRQGAAIGRYELVYADGSTHPLPLRCGSEIRDWWRPADTPESACGWEGSNAQSDSVGLGIFPVVNPKPAQPVKEVRVVSAGEAVPILVALTTADGPPVLTERPVRLEFTDKTAWYPFTFWLDDVNRDSIDLSSLLDPPAGKHGFLRVDAEGHFAFADGTRARFFGTNIGGRSPFPEKAEARILAARLAKYGVNLLRIHAIDSRWAPLIDYAKGNSRSLNAQALDRMDFLVAELKKRGIYVYFDLLDYRRFFPADGVRDADRFEHGWHHSIKGATIFNDRLIELQKEFATQFFTHRNPYTTLRYCDDPAVAVVETTNENSVFYFRNTTLTLPTYVDELKQRWNRWLAERFGDRAALAKAWTNPKGECALLPAEDPAKATVVLPMQHLYQDPAKAPFVGERSPVRVSAMIRYFFDLERRYYGAMRTHLKAIGIKVPITGTNQTFCPASVCVDAVNDFMTRNNYWQHPNVRAKPYVTFRNLAIVRSDLSKTSNPLTAIASSTVAGKPMISPEFNWPWPIEFRGECLPMMAAYACLQDWDGLLFFAYNGERKHLEHFGSQSDPVRWGQFPAAALLFHRGDVAVARKTIHVAWSEAETFAGRRSHREAPISPFRHFTYLSKVRNTFRPQPKTGAAEVVDGATWQAPAQKRYVSDTGELTLDSERRLFTIDTARTKAVVGFVGEQGRVELKGMTVECRNAFAAVMATSLDGKPLGESRRVLLTAVARAENTGQAFTPGKRAIPEKGRAPVLAEPVDARVTLTVPGPVAVYPLDPTGKRRPALPATLEANTLRLDTAKAASPWLEIVGVEGK